MALVLKDRVKETTTTTGTGAVVLGGASTGYQSFSVIGDGNTTYYTITDGTSWEVGIGTYTAATTSLSRDTVLESSNNNNLVNFLAGVKDVFVTYPAGKAVTPDNPLEIDVNSSIDALTIKQLGSGKALSVEGSSTIGTSSSHTTKVNGFMGVGVDPSSSIGVFVAPNYLTGAFQIGVYGRPTINSGAFGGGQGVTGQVYTAAGSFTVQDAIAISANNSIKGAGSTITNQYGVYVANQTAGTNNFGIASFVSAGTNKWNIYASGTAVNYFAGTVKIGGTADRATTAGTRHLSIFNGTAPVGTLTNGISIYSSSGEAYVMDAAGNATLFSPHDSETNEWIFRSKHTPTGKVLKIDVERLLRFVNDHFGLDAVQEFIED